MIRRRMLLVLYLLAVKRIKVSYFLAVWVSTLR